MARLGAVPVGNPIVVNVSGGGSQNIVAHDGAMLGMWVATSQSVALYDSVTTAADVSALAIFTTQAVASGWVNFPATFRRGLAIATSATGNITVVLAE